MWGPLGNLVTGGGMALPLKHSSLPENTCSFPIYTLLPPPLVLFHILRFSEREKPFCTLVSKILHIINVFTRLTQRTAPQISPCLCSFQHLFLSLSLGPRSLSQPAREDQYSQLCNRPISCNNLWFSWKCDKACSWRHLCCLADAFTICWLCLDSSANAGMLL